MHDSQHENILLCTVLVVQLPASSYFQVLIARVSHVCWWGLQLSAHLSTMLDGAGGDGRDPPGVSSLHARQRSQLPDPDAHAFLQVSPPDVHLVSTHPESQ